MPVQRYSSQCKIPPLSISSLVYGTHLSKQRSKQSLISFHYTTNCLIQRSNFAKFTSNIKLPVKMSLGANLINPIPDAQYIPQLNNSFQIF